MFGLRMGTASVEDSWLCQGWAWEMMEADN